jgi:hypothetical protein
MDIASSLWRQGQRPGYLDTANKGLNSIARNTHCDPLTDPPIANSPLAVVHVI